MAISTGDVAKKLLGIQTTEVVNTNKTLSVGNSYVVMDDLTLTIPDKGTANLKNGDTIMLTKLYSKTPTLTCADNFHTINGDNNSIAYDVNSPITLIYNLTTSMWEVVGGGE